MLLRAFASYAVVTGDAGVVLVLPGAALREAFDWSVIARRYAALLDEVIAAARAAPPSA